MTYQEAQELLQEWLIADKWMRRSPVWRQVVLVFLPRRFGLKRLPGAIKDDEEDEVSIATALHQAREWLRNATTADLLRRVAASSLSTEDGRRVEELLALVSSRASARLAPGAVSYAVQGVLASGEERPFASPHYWAGFVAYGAAL